MLARSHPPTFHQVVSEIDPANVCLITSDGARLSFGEVDARAAQLAAALKGRGVEAPAPILIWLPNVTEWVVALLAAAHLGCPVVGVNTRFRAGELQTILRATSAKVLVTSAQLGRLSPASVLAEVDPVVRDFIELVVVTDAQVTDDWFRPAVTMSDLVAGAGALRGLGGPDSPFVAFTTSGTTSAPKLVMHHQTGVATHARAVARSMGLLTPDTRLLQLTPFCGAFGFSQLAAALAAGAVTVMSPTFDAAEAVRLGREHAVSNMFGTDEMLHRMLAATALERPFPHLRFFGQANFNPELQEIGEQAQDRGIFLRGLFGMSETLALFAIQPEDAPLARRAVAGGIPVAGTARVRHLKTGQLLPPGDTGELELTGPGLMVGYLDNDEAAGRAFTDDHYFRTGDLATMIEDGGFIHAGRIGDSMRLSGFLVEPAEIERVLLGAGGIRAAQVVDVATPNGHRPVAFVITTDGALPDAAALISHCQSILAPFKAPIRIFAVDSFPIVESANGVKVQRHILRTRATQMLQEENR